MASWDDENFEPEPLAPGNVAVTDKWEGEDEDDDVKENWEDEEEEKSKEEDDAPKENAAPKAKKITLAEKIAEKERKKREELELRLNEEAELTAEERLKQQQESDLNLFMETTVGKAVSFGDDLKSPTTKEEFEEFGVSLAKKIQSLSKSIEYPAFTEALIRDICVTLTSHDIKKIKITVDNLYLEKQKIEKGDKSKKNKGKGKVKLKMDDNNQLSAYELDTYNEFDDFM